MSRFMCLLFVALICFTYTGCKDSVNNVEFISIDFPHGETRLHVWKDGRAALYYGARPQRETIEVGTFDIKQLYEQIQPRLYPSIPRENWPNPNSIAGMVQIRVKGKGEKVYLIFDEHQFSENLFKKARSNIVERKPL